MPSAGTLRGLSFMPDGAAPDTRVGTGALALTHCTSEGMAAGYRDTQRFKLSDGSRSSMQSGRAASAAIGHSTPLKERP